MQPRRSRRQFLGGLAGVGLVLPLTHFSTSLAAPLEPTPSCSDDDEPTQAQIEGPYFTPGSPERANLRDAGMAGTPIVLTGYVLSLNCRPMAGVLVDLWHADDGGNYDNEGYRLRGHQFTGPDGTYRFETIVPGFYPGRTRHFQPKFQAPNQPVLTTQFYFPGEPRNLSDAFFQPELLLSMAEEPEKLGRYDVVLDIA